MRAAWQAGLVMDSTHQQLIGEHPCQPLCPLCNALPHPRTAPARLHAPSGRSEPNRVDA